MSTRFSYGQQPTEAIASLNALDDSFNASVSAGTDAVTSKNAAAASAAAAAISSTIATTQATTAATQSGIATVQAGIATYQSGIATTQAAIATTQAALAASSAAAAGASPAASASAAAAATSAASAAASAVTASGYNYSNLHQAPSTNNILVGTTTDNGIDKLQISGGITTAGDYTFVKGDGILCHLWCGGYGGVVQLQKHGATTDRFARIGITDNSRVWIGGLTINGTNGGGSFSNGLGTVLSGAGDLTQLNISNNVVIPGTPVSASVRFGNDTLPFYGFRIQNLNDPSATSAGIFKIQRGAISSWQDVLIIDDAGNIRLGTSVSNGVDKLQVAGSAMVVGDINLYGNTVLRTVWGGAFGGAVQILSDSATVARFSRIGMVTGSGTWLGGLTINNDTSGSFSSSLSVTGGIGCHGAAPPAQVSLNGPCTDLTTAMALLNQMRAMHIASGQAI